VNKHDDDKKNIININDNDDNDDDNDDDNNNNIIVLQRPHVLVRTSISIYRLAAEAKTPSHSTPLPSLDKVRIRHRSSESKWPLNFP